MTHDEYVDLLKTTVLKQATKSVVKIIITKLPFLSWGPLAPILNLVVTKILEIAINQTEMAIYFAYTDFRVSRQGRVYQEALELNLEAQKSGDQEKIKDAEENLKVKFIELISLTN